jgi:hypothetical protein
MTGLVGMVDSYNARSLKHEHGMLAVYRRESVRDAGLLQPLSNACLRAAAFEWALARDPEPVRRLWAEAARALAHGFARKRKGFDPSPDQFILAIELSIASREAEAFTTLARFAPGVRSTAMQGAQAFRGGRGHFQLAESYALIAGAILERRRQPASAAIQSLTAATEESGGGWWEERFPDPSEAAWLMAEHSGICELLKIIVESASEKPTPLIEESKSPVARANPNLVERFGSVMDKVLTHLKWFVESEADHHPKLYVWLPGIAISALATAAGMPMAWLQARHEELAPEYSRLPLELIFN